MTNILGLVIRAKANVSGGLTMAITPARDCKGNVAGIFLHDKDDTQNSIAGACTREAFSSTRTAVR